MEKVLLGVGAVSFIGYLIWLIVSIKNWDSKIPPIVGMALSVIMIFSALVMMPNFWKAVPNFKETTLFNNIKELHNAESVYTPPSDVELVYSGVSSNIVGNFTNHVVKNNSDRTIKNIQVVFAEFDRNGFFLADSETNRRKKDYPSINLLKDQITILYAGSPISDNAQYVEGAISKIEYMNGDVWESDSLKTWFSEMEKGIDIEMKKSVIEEMREFAGEAEKNDYISLRFLGCSPKNRYTEVSFSTDVFNTNGKVIQSFEITALCFDKNGFPLNVADGCYLANNTIVYEQKGINISSSGNGEGVFSIAHDTESISSVKGIISKISFSNGDVWENPYEPYWELYYGDVIGK